MDSAACFAFFWKFFNTWIQYSVLLYSLRPEISCAGEENFDLHTVLQKRPRYLNFEAIKSLQSAPTPRCTQSGHDQRPRTIQPRSAPACDPLPAAAFGAPSPAALYPRSLAGDPIPPPPSVTTSRSSLAGGRVRSSLAGVVLRIRSSLAGGRVRSSLAGVVLRIRSSLTGAPVPPPPSATPSRSYLANALRRRGCPLKQELC
jgi:hypothetical protein